MTPPQYCTLHATFIACQEQWLALNVAPLWLWSQALSTHIL
jgi:hypothetical protein